MQLTQVHSISLFVYFQMDYFSQHIFSDPEEKKRRTIAFGFPPLTAVFPPFRLAVIIVYYTCIFQKIIHPKDPLSPRTPIFPPFKFLPAPITLHWKCNVYLEPERRGVVPLNSADVSGCIDVWQGGSRLPVHQHTSILTHTQLQERGGRY